MTAAAVTVYAAICPTARLPGNQQHRHRYPGIATGLATNLVILVHRTMRVPGFSRPKFLCAARSRRPSEPF